MTAHSVGRSALAPRARSLGRGPRLRAFGLAIVLFALASTASACAGNGNGHSPTATAPVQTSVPASASGTGATNTSAPPSATDTPDPELNTEESPQLTGSPAVGSPSSAVMPNPDVTPGDVFAVGVAEICVSGYASRVRNVSSSTKNAVYAEYGIVSHTTGQYEIDHLIPLAIGGSNDIRNLWPQPAEPQPGFHEKDRLENKLRALVCAGSLDLATAQRDIATDWYTAYVQFVLIGQVPTPQSGTPTSTPVASPATTLRFISIRGAAPGGEASATVHASAGASCAITYITPAGTTSTAQGLAPAVADGEGIASWIWRISASTRAGVGTVTVTCGAGSVTAAITIG